MGPSGPPYKRHDATVAMSIKNEVERENGNVVKYKAQWCVDGSRNPLDIAPEAKFITLL